MRLDDSGDFTSLTQNFPHSPSVLADDIADMITPPRASESSKTSCTEEDSLSPEVGRRMLSRAEEDVLRLRNVPKTPRTLLGKLSIPTSTPAVPRSPKRGAPTKRSAIRDDEYAHITRKRLIAHIPPGLDSMSARPLFAAATAYLTTRMFVLR